MINLMETPLIRADFTAKQGISLALMDKMVSVKCIYIILYDIVRTKLKENKGKERKEREKLFKTTGGRQNTWFFVGKHGKCKLSNQPLYIIIYGVCRDKEKKIDRRYNELSI